MSDDRTLEVTDDPTGSRFVATDGGTEVGSAYYRLQGDTVVFTHTEVDPDREGQGVGSALAKGALDAVVASGRRFVPRCPFVARYVERHPEYATHVAS